MNTPLRVTKISGELVPFEIGKLRQSLQEAGASESTAQQITSKIQGILYDGISTKEIYRKAHQLLKNRTKSHASRYGLKKAILQLGPTGYPFELFIAEVMKKEGYSTEVGLVMPGKCVTHEVDVYAFNDTTVRMMECKFHNRLGYKTDVKVPMYIKSRFEDVAAMWAQDAKINSKKHEGWVVTNARFTQDAIQFGRCSGLHLLSWDYPVGAGLKKLVDQHRLYPLTLVNSLTKLEKERLMENGTTLASTIAHHADTLKAIGMDDKRTLKAQEEAKAICEY